VTPLTQCVSPIVGDYPSYEAVAQGAIGAGSVGSTGLSANSLSGGINSGGEFVRAGLVEVASFSTNYCINGSACASNVPLLLVADADAIGINDFFATAVNTGAGT